MFGFEALNGLHFRSTPLIHTVAGFFKFADLFEVEVSAFGREVNRNRTRDVNEDAMNAGSRRRPRA
jgi:hypothetical protein